MIDAILTHYGFARLPFGKNIAPDEIFPTESMKEAGAMIELGLESEDIILITGRSVAEIDLHCVESPASSTPIAIRWSICEAVSHRRLSCTSSCSWG